MEAVNAHVVHIFNKCQRDFGLLTSSMSKLRSFIGAGLLAPLLLGGGGGEMPRGCVNSVCIRGLHQQPTLDFAIPIYIFSLKQFRNFEL